MKNEGDQVYGDGRLLDLLMTLYCTPILIYNIVTWSLYKYDILILPQFF